MAKITQYWSVTLSLEDREEGAYGSRQIGSTTLRIPRDHESRVGAITQAHVGSIRETADLTSGEHAAVEVDPVSI